MPPPELRAVVDKLNALREPPQRARALAAMLGTGEADDWVALLAALLDRVARLRAPADQVAVACVAQAVHEELLGYDARRRLYEAARARGAEPVARLLLGAGPGAIDEREVQAALRPERPLRPDGRPLTLGERKALARSPRRELLLPLLADPHPDVVGNLLLNPRLSERDVVAIAASRKVAPAALERIARHPRWSTRLAVRRAVVFNPRTPLPCALRLAVTLGRADLAELAGSAFLAESLRQHAAELAAVGRATGGPGSSRGAEGPPDDPHEGAG